MISGGKRSDDALRRRTVKILLLAVALVATGLSAQEKPAAPPRYFQIPRGVWQEKEGALWLQIAEGNTLLFRSLGNLQATRIEFRVTQRVRNEYWGCSASATAVTLELAAEPAPPNPADLSWANGELCLVLHYKIDRSLELSIFQDGVMRRQIALLPYRAAPRRR